MTNTVDTMLNEIEEIVREASSYMEKDFSVQSKDGISNLVTTSDVAVETFLKENLKNLIPDAGFIAEESEMDYKGHEFVWVIDPIDGTANYVRDLGASAISVGLLKNMQPYMSVVYNPYRNELFYAQKGRGCYCNGTKITVSDRDFAHSCICTALCLYKKELEPYCTKVLSKVYHECDDFRRFGSAVVEMSNLAAGRVELFFEIRLSPWDHCACRLLVEEAGGVVGTLYEEEMDYTRPVPVIAANTRENYEHLKKMILQEIPECPYGNE